MRVRIRCQGFIEVLVGDGDGDGVGDGDGGGGGESAGF